jgi:4-diphosphocytidyl-2-C-methyl-D-erythritol kinase
MSVSVFAPAKINLTLEIGRPRADGLHPLQSVVVFADVGDVVTAEAADTLSLSVAGDFAADLDADDDNLVLRAARTLQRHVGRPELGARLYLAKHLPIASGIGGGSSDAAATLKALNALWDLELSLSYLRTVADELGADVPVCVPAAPAYMTGIGKSFLPISAPSFSAILINPLTPLPTPDVYRQFDRMDLGGAFAERTPPKWTSVADALAYISATGNTLEAPAQALLPALDEIAASLRAQPKVRYAALSGSGATMFALVRTRDHAEALAETWQRAHTDWWVADTILGAA